MRHGSLIPLVVLLPVLACGGQTADPCPDDQVRVEDTCVTPDDCDPGALRCDGPRIATRCNDSGTGWEVSETCQGEYLCQAGECLGQWVCEADDPPCCVEMADCGAVLTSSGCSECRPISRSGWCDAAACVSHDGPLIGFSLVADLRLLPAATAGALRSAVATIYQPYAADGRVVDCESVLDESQGPSLHDAKSPELNPVFSGAYQLDVSGGSNQATLPFGGVPEQPGVVLVLTGYDHASGAGQALARGCLDQQSPSDGATLLLELESR